MLRLPPDQRLTDLETWIGHGGVLNVRGSLYDTDSFTGTPFAGLALKPLTRAAEQSLGVVWTFGTLLLVVVLGLLVAHALPKPTSRRASLIAAPVAISLMVLSLPVRSTFTLGQTSLLPVLFVVLACLPGTPQRRSGVLVGLAAALQPAVLVFAAFLWLARRRTAGVTAAVTFGVCTVLAWVLLPSDSATYWVHHVAGAGLGEPADSLSNQSLHGLLLRLGLHGPIELLLFGVLAGVVGVVGLRRAAGYARDGQVLLATAVAGCVAVAVSPAAWQHQQLWILLAVLGRVGTRREDRLVWPVFVVLVMSLGSDALVPGIPVVTFLGENAPLMAALLAVTVIPFLPRRSPAWNRPIPAAVSRPRGFTGDDGTGAADTPTSDHSTTPEPVPSKDGVSPAADVSVADGVPSANQGSSTGKMASAGQVSATAKLAAQAPVSVTRPRAGDQLVPGGTANGSADRFLDKPLLSYLPRLVSRPNLLMELLMIRVGYWAYSYVRGSVPDQRHSAERNGHQILGAERFLHIDVEHWLNQRIITTPWLESGMNFFYSSFHFVVPLTLLGFLYIRKPAAYRAARTSLSVATLLGLVGFWSYPLAPPRLMPGLDYIDTVHGPQDLAHPEFGALTKLSNQYAAMPSLHVGWALWSGLMIVALTRHRWLRWLGLLYPALTAVVVMSTANHYALDAVGGAVVVVCGLSAAYLIAGRSALAQMLPGLAPAPPRSEATTAPPDGALPRPTQSAEQARR